jgi:flagellar basal-body rod protein FlgC
MNTAASNLANAGAVADNPDAAYRALRPVFQSEIERASGLATVNVSRVIPSDAEPIKRRDPDHPLADANGDVWVADIDQQGEMVEIMESARQYQNLVEALQTAKQLMLETMRST